MRARANRFRKRMQRNEILLSEVNDLTNFPIPERLCLLGKLVTRSRAELQELQENEDGPCLECLEKERSNREAIETLQFKVYYWLLFTC